MVEITVAQNLPLSQESVARNFVNDLSKIGHEGIWLPDARRVVEKFLDDVNKIPEQDRKKVIERAQELNDNVRRSDGNAHTVAFIFGDLDFDGKEDELADVSLVFEKKQFDGPNTLYIPTVLDLYEPPARPKPGMR